MVRERNRMERTLAPVSESHACAVVAALLTGWPSYGESEQDSDTLVRLIARAVRNQPAWAVEEAARRFRDDQVSFPWPPRQAPTPPAFARETRNITMTHRVELADLIRVLDAAIIPDPDPAMAERARQVAADVVARRATETRERLDAAAAVEEADRTAILSGPAIQSGAISPAALAKFLPRERRSAEAV